MVAEAECSAGGRLKHVDVKYRFATEAVRNREVRVRYIPTNLNFADIMTMVLVPKKHKESVELIVFIRGRGIKMRILVHFTFRGAAYARCVASGSYW
jgi:hypothetical protein